MGSARVPRHARARCRSAATATRSSPTGRATRPTWWPRSSAAIRSAGRRPVPETKPAIWTEPVKDDSGNRRPAVRRSTCATSSTASSRASSPISDLESGHRVATACHLANISLRTGRKIRWDADEGRDRRRSRGLTHAGPAVPQALGRRTAGVGDFVNVLDVGRSIIASNGDAVGLRPTWTASHYALGWQLYCRPLTPPTRGGSTTATPTRP